MSHHYIPTLKPFTDALRKRIRSMSVPSVIVLEKDDFKPCTHWFTHENNSSRYFSVRQMDDRLFVFRLK